jgi:DNA-directed RNA polymerase subunit K/omega
MVTRPVKFQAYEFSVVCGLRAKQLLAGCTPRLPGDHGASTMAQMEVAAGCVERATLDDAASGKPARTPAA